MSNYACPTCQNFGKVVLTHVNPEDPRGPRIVSKPITCPTCKGRGR